MIRLHSRGIRLHSLRARLLLTVSIATLLVWGAAGVASYDQALHEADELMDGQLAQSAKLLMAQVLHEADELEAKGLSAAPAEITQNLDYDASHPYEQHLEFRVLNRNGLLLLRSAQAPEMGAPTPDREIATYRDIKHAGQPWRQLSLRSPDGSYLVQIAHPIQERERVGLEVASQVALPIILALPILALLVYFSVRSSLKPLEELAADVHAVAGGKPLRRVRRAGEGVLRIGSGRTAHLAAHRAVGHREVTAGGLSADAGERQAKEQSSFEVFSSFHCQTTELVRQILQGAAPYPKLGVGLPSTGGITGSRALRASRRGGSARTGVPQRS